MDLLTVDQERKLHKSIKSMSFIVLIVNDQNYE